MIYNHKDPIINRMICKYQYIYIHIYTFIYFINFVINTIRSTLDSEDKYIDEKRFTEKQYL